MPLEAHVTAVREKILAHLRPGRRAARTLVVRTAPEMFQQAGKLIRSTENETAWIFSAQPGEGDDPASFFATWSRDLEKQFERARPRWRELDTDRGRALASIELPVSDARLSTEARYARWFDDLADRIGTACRHGLLLLVFADDDLEEANVRALVELSRDLRSPRVRLLVVDARREPVFPADTKAVETVHFALSAEEMRRGATVKLARPDLSARERFCLLLMMAGFAAGDRRFDEALSFASQATSLAQTTGDASHPPMAALSTAYIHYQRGAFDRARDVLLPAADAASESAETRRFLGPILNLLASSHMRLDAYEDAIALYGAAGALERETGNLVLALHLDLWRGEALRRSGRTDEARNVWGAVVADARALANDFPDARATCEAEALERLAMLADTDGRRSDARDLHAEATRICSHCHVPHQP